ncbi:MAG: histone deacetylase family protein [Pseudomonadales bacterium]|nr:histone deacetylase family protein [Pseudomonadales bacterium]
MPLDYISHPQCLLHLNHSRHPERPERITAITEYLAASGLQQEFRQILATPISIERVKKLHQPALITQLQDESEKLSGTDKRYMLDPDTGMCAHSLNAALLAAGAVQQGVERVLNGQSIRAFCAVRPPGHHAEEATSMGFCLINNVALGAIRALEYAEVNRVAILDFDVHHCNGTVDLFKNHSDIMVCSSFQHPYYPNRLFSIKKDNIVNTPLQAGTPGPQFRVAIERDWIPAIQAFKPDLIMVSAGFDAHKDDPLADLLLTEEDFTWVSQLIVSLANTYCNGRIVSSLEGGYTLDALARSVAAHLAVLKDN